MNDKAMMQDLINKDKEKCLQVTLRDQFAMAALQGMNLPDEAEYKDHYAVSAYQYADAMLEARKK